ncbi:PREDICTED: guanine nucleotide-binding protein subunit beta-like protein 1 isoform X1 [Branchiostoma belcheri]|uniref:Guanine nucleotide-binding protein subunit beta-like protein 1 isoform X1 n=1 Tax=Branchiostoma belcheri TaxID=7741 RepID=A0A6P5AZL2_BRABE|nr:PREDICTED: guanine nucleotide-binding protein subunit beta-like protein 1 isoform X1 [Branchiostoma belcheri]
MSRPPPDPVFVLRGSDVAVSCLKFRCREADSTKLLFSGTAGGKIHPWDLQTKRSLGVLDGHGGQGVLSLGLCGEDNAVLYSQGRDGTVALWDLQEGRNNVSHRIPVPAVGFCQVEMFSHGTGRLLAAAGASQAEVAVMDLRSKKPVFSLQPAEGCSPQGMVMALKAASGSDCSPLLAAYEDGSVAVWDVKQRQIVSHLRAHTEPILCMDYDQEQGKGITGSADNKLIVWTNKDGQLATKQTVELSNPGLSCVKIRGDRKLVVTGGWDHLIRLYGWKKMKPLAVLDYHTDTVQCVDFSDHENSVDRLLAAGSKDQRISLWSIYNQ